MAFQRVASVEDLPPGTTLEFTTGQWRVAVSNVAGELHAMNGTCPHRGGQLAYGAMHGRILVCPFHGWEFDCTTGVLEGSSVVRQRKFDVKVEGGDILVDVD